MSDETVLDVTDVKAAVTSAYQYIREFQDLMGTELDDLRLEEVERSEDEKTWLVTLGYDVPIKRKSALDEMMQPLNASRGFKREYKIFAVNASTGKVESMKIRQV